MTHAIRSRKGIAAASIAVFLFVSFAAMINGLMWAKCKAGADCDPFGSESMGDKISSASEDAKAISTAAQFMLGLEVLEDMNVYPATEKYSYCREGPGDVGRYRCANTPTEQEISDATGSFSPYPQTLLDVISKSLPFLQGFGYEFTLSQNSNTYIEAGDGSTDGGTSRFIFMLPIAGAENIKLKLEMTKGSTAVGVVE